MTISGDVVLTQARLATPEKVLTDSWLRVSQGRIAEMGVGAPPAGTQLDLDGALVVPGFIDLHCHGGGGGSFSSTNEKELLTAIETHQHHGTTTLLASLISDPIPLLCEQIAALRELVQDGLLAGIHLEGPFLSHAHCGAHNTAVLREPDTDTVDTLLNAGKGTIRMVTLAPELPGGIAAIQQLVAAGVIAAIGHTDGYEKQIMAALDAGATVATHLFNAMRALHHREPGPIGTLLDDERVTVELICDLVHVHPTVLRLAATHAGIDRTILITDAMAATGAEDGRYHLGELEVDVRNGVATLAETDVLAGSTLTMDAAFRNMVQGVGLDLFAAVHATSTKPAELLGLSEKTGALRPGLAADLVILDSDLRPTQVMRHGSWIR